MEVEVVVAHHERATLRVGDVFLKIDADQARLYDLASLTLGHEERLDDVITGYATDVDLDVIRAWWSLRSLVAISWLVEHGFDPSSPGCEVDVLRSRL